MTCRECEAFCRDEFGAGCLALRFSPRQKRDGSWGCNRPADQIYYMMQAWRINTPRSIKEKLKFAYPKKQPNEDKLDNVPVSRFKQWREMQILKEREERHQRAKERAREHDRKYRERKRAEREAAKKAAEVASKGEPNEDI